MEAGLQNITPNSEAFAEIDNKYKQRAKWISDHLKKKQEEEQTKQKEAIEYKLKLMEGQDMESQKSEESDEEQQHQRGEIQDAVDGLL